MTAPRAVALVQLDRANEVRAGRKLLKRYVAEGRARLIDALTDDPDLRGMKLAELLCSAPGLGHTKVDRALRIAQIPSNATIREVSAEQRRHLLEFIARKHPGVRL
jgi:5S rRNA maturation endonuclease (ribonuclease M5)